MASSNASRAADGLRNLFPELQNHRLDAVVAGFGGNLPNLNLPLGAAVGREALAAFVQQQHQWMVDHAVRVEPGPLWTGPARLFHELTLWVRVDGAERELPVLLAGDVDAQGALIAVRGYHSTWPLTGGHRVRPALLPVDPSIVLTDPFRAYEAALSGGDPAEIKKTMTEDGYMREPSGSQYSHAGADRDTFFDELGSGGVGIHLCTYTDAGRAQIMEYICYRLGSIEIPPTAGGAVYENNGAGLIVAAHVYDDASPDATD